MPFISQIRKSWNRFAHSDKDISYFLYGNMDYTPDTRARINGIIASLQQIFGEIEALEDSLHGMEEGCKKLAERLQFDLTQQSSQYGMFTIQIISPIVIVAAIFSIPTQLFPYRQSLVSFIVTSLIVSLLLYLLLLLIGAWHRRQQWCRKLSLRAKAAWHHGDSLKVGNGIIMRAIRVMRVMRVIRRRSTHTDSAGDV